jgi:hypothetical protein
MNIIERYDSWVRNCVKDALDWLNEWFSISQKMVERTLIGIYAIASVMMISGVYISHLHTSYVWIWAILQLWMIFILYMYHIDSSTMRRIKHNNSISALSRMTWYFLILFAALPPYKQWLMDIGLPISDMTFLLVLYVVSVNSDGQRGRKRKLALAKLKELFSWLPEPVPEGV